MPAASRRLSLLTCLFVLAACPGGDKGDTTDAASTGPAASTGTAASTGAPTTGGSTGGSTGPASYPDPFSVTVLDKQWISGTGGWDTQHKDVMIDLGPATFAKVTLVVDLESDCYPWEKWQTSPPPNGQNWPAACDAFDRTMGFIADPALQDGDPLGFELLRSITPFGGPEHLEEDITDWANAHPGVHSLRSYIDSWPDGAGKVSGSAGGWHLSVRLDIEPGPPPRDVLGVYSLYQGGYTVDTPAPNVPFTLPEGTAAVELSYIVSGHGGANDVVGDCIGPAEEFCKRVHHLMIDGGSAGDFTPWRIDCLDLCTITDNPIPEGPAKYCLENPCGAIASVQAPRANWCPGSRVAPVRGPVDKYLTQGADHTFGFTIDGVVPGGIWNVSATLYAYGP